MTFDLLYTRMMLLQVVDPNSLTNIRGEHKVGRPQAK